MPRNENEPPPPAEPPTNTEKTKSKKSKKKKDKTRKANHNALTAEELFDNNDRQDENDAGEPMTRHSKGGGKKRKKTTAVTPRKRQKSTTPEEDAELSDDLDECPSVMHSGCWYARHVDLWITPNAAVMAGIKASQNTEENIEPAKKKNMANSLEERSLEIYHYLTNDKDINFADLQKLFVADEDGDNEQDNGEVNVSAICEYTKQMQFHASRARADDTGKLKRDMDKLLAKPGSRQVKVWSKSAMGWNSKDTACLLCPVDDVWEFDQDPQMYMDSVLNGGSKHWSEWSTFLYDKDLLDEDNPVTGLFQSPLLVRVFNHIYNSSGIDKLNSVKTKPPVSRIHGMTEVTPEDIAYICVQPTDSSPPVITNDVESQGPWV
ncbi:hypothetical protein VKT23_009868 [Stygiomarasmius scandens]|uniref:Uncharacterized protein n=1 Tax=Marasmiellus scandens TaxID=2682957 RepID=A0ABR1JGA0_9AGAR